MSLLERLMRLIGEEGPIGIDRYMDLCLHDPDFGYYARRPRLGPEGDFITAPQVSQMLGELVGLWAAHIFEGLGRPPRLRLVELGPGHGSMMADVARALGQAAPDVLTASEILLLETSAPLRARQGAALAGLFVRWIADFNEIGDDRPVVILANEFLDCFPIRQTVRTADGWKQRRVGLDDGRLAFVAGEEVSLDAWLPPAAAPLGAVVESSPALLEFGARVGGLVRRAGGAALFLDYGGAQVDGWGDTLQSLRGHRRHGPLEAPGEVDLTAHVAFAPFLAQARRAGAEAPAPVTQAKFLRALGIEARAAALARAHPDRADAIGRQLRRLIGCDQMGALFKAACIHSQSLAPAGFEDR